MGKQYKNPPSAEVECLQRLYIFRGWIEIADFLERYPFLVSLLVEAHNEIQTFFPYSSIVLQVITDPEETDADQLVAFIVTDLHPDNALDALNRFDKSWWLGALKRAQGKFCITLGFQ